MFRTHEAMTRARTRSAATKARRKGCAPHPTTILDERYTPDELAFLRAVAAWRRQTGRSVPELSGLVLILNGMDYQGGAPDPERFNEAVSSWRRREDRRFPTATALFGIMLGFGFTKEGRS